MKKNIFIGFSLVLFSAAFIVILFFPQDSSTQIPSKISEQKSPLEIKKIEKIAPVSLKYFWLPGDYFIYNFVYDTTGSMLDIKAAQSNKNPLAFKITGKLHKKIYEVKKEGAFVGYSIATSSLLLGENNRELVKNYIKALNTEIYVVINTMGFIKRWYFPQSIPGNLCNIIKSLLLNSQVILSEKPSVEWISEEVDQNGSYQAKYSLKQSNKIQKQKLQYTDIVEGLKIYSCKSTGMIDFQKKEGYVKALEFEEHVQYQSLNIVTNASIKINMSLEKKTNDSTLIGTLQGKLKREGFTVSTSSNVEGQEEMERLMLQKRVGKLTWKDFLTKMKEVKERKDCPQLILQLRAWMQLNPTKLYLAAQKILESKELSADVYALIRALGSVDPHGQDVLVDVIKKRSENKDYVYESLSCLTFVNKPTQTTIETFQDLAKNYKEENIRSTALLGLGSLASRFVENSPEKTSLIVYDLEQKVQNTQDKNEKILLIDALGNAGSSSSLPYLSQLVQDKDIAIRSSALLALRSMNDSRADEILANAIQEYKDHPTLKNALNAIEYRKASPTLFSSVKQKLAEEKSEELKIRELQILWNMRKMFPEAETILRNYAHNDPSEKVKNNAKAMMLASGVRY